MDIVLKLRELRRMRGLTQRQAEEKSGVGYRTISTFETADRIMSMKLWQFLAILEAYDVTPAEFFGSNVEQAVFADLEALTNDEASLIAALRRLPATQRARLVDHFVASIAAVEVTAERRLRAVR
jgi:transcriptional regulator with XRE-family HTH domain